MSQVLQYCTHCGQLVDAYEASAVEPGNPAGDRMYFCRPCGREWPAPNVYTAGQPCERCGGSVIAGLWYCGACGHPTLDAPAPPTERTPR
jgi:DNA-directed RNA polymerase subunit RPC12/RpoP